MGHIGKAEVDMLSFRGQIGPLQIGLANALNGMMLVFASPSNRTAPYLQAILGNFIIPMTIILRALLLRKMPTKPQCVAALLVLGGLFVTLIPTLQHGSSKQQTGSMFWPAWFMLGFTPGALMNVIEEKVLKSENRNVGMVWFIFWLNVWQFIFISAFFWLDILPSYGMSTDIVNWAEHLRKGFGCVAMGNGCGTEGITWGSSFILNYMLAYLAGGMLLKYSEGSVWQALVMALVGPLGTAWWTIFAHKPHFHYAPEWLDKSTFAMLGLGLIMPGIVIYKLRSNADDGVIEPLTDPESDTKKEANTVDDTHATLLAV